MSKTINYSSSSKNIKSRSEDDPPEYWEGSTNTKNIWRANYWINQYMLIRPKLSKHQLDIIDKNIAYQRKASNRPKQAVDCSNDELSLKDTIWEFAYRTRKARDIIEDII